MAVYINGNAVRPGYVIKYNDVLYRVMSSEHRTPGNKRAFMQVKLRHLENGTQTDVKLRADEQLERATLEQAEMEFLYNDDSGYCFMNCETYDQVFLQEADVESVKPYLLANTKVRVEFYEGSPIGVTPPDNVDLKVTDTEPPFKGATAAGGGKPATLETGLTVTVPNFIEVGETVRIATASGEYLERTKN